ncbi:putative pentatricopeptide repeat-containing protein At3g23330 [Telopea speciosissima]|uniref:putative pentatricopeptide repeat-containing protein At3g23330 n=1 Tax=Telopea speciosissima TaxID=54955 RepID=UPI001CC6C9C3|nr:putative pentatricopeptide repeat-containing protein At3g23330 [Telopea speciosissima]
MRVMDSWRSPSAGFSRCILLFLVYSALLASYPVFAQGVETEAGTDKDLFNESGKALSRRSKIFLDQQLGNNVAGDKNDPDLLGLSGISETSGLGVLDAFFASLSMIIVTEIGDETFIIAALMAMRHPKSIVLSGALSALYVMTVLSTGLGRILPNLISRKHTNSAATVLYAFFGLRLLYIAWRSNSKSSQKKEMEEVEEKLEAGQGKTTIRRFFSRFCTPIFLESFILTFLAEWGDRSQIATIALATHKNAFGVAVGASIGHTICTSIAVVGGSMLASKISQRTVATIGGLLFLGFSISSYFYPPLRRRRMPPSPITHFAANGIIKFPRFILCLFTSSQPTELIFASITTRNFLEVAQRNSHLIHSFSCTEHQHRVPFNSISNLPITKEVEPLHAQAVKNGSAQHGQVGNHLLNLYVKCSNLDQAQKLFDEISNRDVRTWTLLITGFAQRGLAKLGLDLFSQMQYDGVCPNCFTLTSVLKCCSCLNDLQKGKEIHGWVLRKRVGFDVVLENAMIDHYIKYGNFDYARIIFESMTKRDTVSWNIMIGAYLHFGDVDKSLELFRQLPVKDVATWNTIIAGLMQNGSNMKALELLYQMGEIGLQFKNITFSIALAIFSSLSLLELGRQTHGKVLRVGLQSDGFIRNSLINMYCKCGEMEKALAISKETPQATHGMQSSNISYDASVSNSVLWSSIVSGYVQNCRVEDALKLFREMVHEGVEMDQFILTSIASACANAGILEQGLQIHALIEKSGHKFDAFLGSAIIDMYAKCGSLDDARSIFLQTDNRNTVLWTSMISGCALHGQGRESIHLFELMLKEGVGPNEVSFVGVLSGCSHAGLVEEGHAYFRSMQEDFGIVPAVEHFTCMVDLLGRAGHLHEAEEFIHSNGISRISSVWKALLSACRLHKKIVMGKWVSDQLLELEPFSAGPYVLLSNICANSHRWEEVAEARSMMEQRGIKKNPGQSWIQLKNQLHTFFMGDRSHPQVTEIYSYLERLISRLKEIGYSIDTDLVMHDVEEEQREILLGFHSEKLAVTYALMSTPSGSLIRVMKNLRICTDCHAFIKYTSQVMGREIVVRDPYRFHHFKDGQCSCGDYW